MREGGLGVCNWLALRGEGMVDWKAESMIYNLPEEERMSIPYAPFLSHPLPPSMGGSKCAAKMV